MPVDTLTRADLLRAVHRASLLSDAATCRRIAADARLRLSSPAADDLDREHLSIRAEAAERTARRREREAGLLPALPAPGRISPAKSAPWEGGPVPGVFESMFIDFGDGASEPAPPSARAASLRTGYEGARRRVLAVRLGRACRDHAGRAASLELADVPGWLEEARYLRRACEESGPAAVARWEYWLGGEGGVFTLLEDVLRMEAEDAASASNHDDTDADTEGARSNGEA